MRGRSEDGDAQKHDWGKMSKEVSSSQFSARTCACVCVCAATRNRRSACPRPRWLPQAVYCACAEGRITARMDSNGFGIAITARHGFGGDAQKHDWVRCQKKSKEVKEVKRSQKKSKEVSSSQFSARTCACVCVCAATRNRRSTCPRPRWLPRLPPRACPRPRWLPRCCSVGG